VVNKLVHDARLNNLCALDRKNKNKLKGKKKLSRSHSLTNANKLNKTMSKILKRL